MSKQKTVSVEEVRRVADLANLALTPEEEPRMQKDLNAILDYVDLLNELDTEGVAPMAQVSGMLVEVVDQRQVLREDIVQPSIDRAKVMSAAPDTDGRFFKVPKVIER
jgi:aspartyl-tRNA(Asn)/glutamyl-tRNA(Gln) amidotransferase subunit C